jgi:hypothetical protein
MKLSNSKIAAVIAASMIALSSTAYAAGNQGNGGTENSCAVGNMPVPGANCTP